MSKYLELAKKLKELAERGVDGEKVNAEQLLHKIMKKHNITEEDLNDLKEETFCFNVQGKYKEFESQLLVQIAGQLDLHIRGEFKKADMKNYHLDGNFGLICTKFQFIEIKSKFDFYRSQLTKRLDEFMFAFFITNKLLIEPKNKDCKNNVTDEFIENAITISRSIKANEFYKQLTQ